MLCADGFVGKVITVYLSLLFPEKVSGGVEVAGVERVLKQKECRLRNSPNLNYDHKLG